LVTFGVFVVNQTADVVALGNALNPTFGRVLLWSLIALYTVLLLVPFYMWIRMPAALVPPDREDCPEFEQHLSMLARRLIASGRLKQVGQVQPARVEIEKAIGQLHLEANQIVCRTASAVFLSTAISQSGRLDALVVLATQVKMVWQVAHVYQQRPSAREMLGLYANVAATSFLAGELDDIQVEPLVAPVLGATLGSVPGLQQVTAVVVRSALSGAANAFLTLRIGMITKRYCGSLVIADKRIVRRLATAEAAKLLTGIVSDGVARISKGLWSASTSRVKRAFGSRTGTSGPIDLGLDASSKL
jgi:hypothetical protein